MDDHDAHGGGSGLSSSSMISISGIEYQIRGREIDYQIQVHAGAVQAWVITKVYEDFEDLHAELQREYGKNQLPYLTGRVAPWNVGTRETGARRLKRFEEYLSQLASNSLSYDPPDLVVQIPHPDDPTTLVVVNKYVFEFLEFIGNFKIQAPPSAPPSAPVATAGGGSDDAMKTQPSSTTGAGGQGTAEDGLSAADTQSSVGDGGGGSVHSLGNQNEKKSSSEPRGGGEVELTAAQLDSAHITSQIQACVVHFNLFPGSHIAYTLEVKLCTVRWSLDKRFTDFVQLRTDLAAMYGEDRVPRLDDAFVSPSDRLLEMTAMLRQQEMTKLLQLCLPEVDNWTPKGLVAELKLPFQEKKDEFLRVFLNKLIFDFLEIDKFSARMKAESAESDIERKKMLLNKHQKQLLEQERQRKIRKAFNTVFYNRRKVMRPISEHKLEDLCELIGSMDDDRDALAVVTHFCKTGEIVHDIVHEVPGVTSSVNQYGNPGGSGVSGASPQYGSPQQQQYSNIPGASLLQSSTSHQFQTPIGRENTWAYENEDAFADGGAALSRAATSTTFDESTIVTTESPVGLTSIQLTQLAACVVFCDTRVECIQIAAATVLLDDEALAAVVDTVEYDWESLLENIEETLLAGTAELKLLTANKKRPTS